MKKKLKLTACALLIAGMMQVTPQIQASNWSSGWRFLPQETHQQAVLAAATLAALAALGTVWWNRRAIGQFLSKRAKLVGGKMMIDAADAKTQAKQEILRQLIADLENPNKNKVVAFKDAIKKYQDLMNNKNYKLEVQDYIELFNTAKNKFKGNLKQYVQIIRALISSLSKMDTEDQKQIVNAVIIHVTQQLGGGVAATALNVLRIGKS